MSTVSQFIRIRTSLKYTFFPYILGLDGPRFESRQGKWDFFCLRKTRPALGPRQPPIQLAQSLFPGGTAAEAWCWPVTSLQRQGKEWVELYLYSPYVPSWRGQGQIYLLYSYATSSKYEQNAVGDATWKPHSIYSFHCLIVSELLNIPIITYHG